MQRTSRANRDQPQLITWGGLLVCSVGWLTRLFWDLTYDSPSLFGISVDGPEVLVGDDRRPEAQDGRLVARAVTSWAD